MSIWRRIGQHLRWRLHPLSRGRTPRGRAGYVHVPEDASYWDRRRFMREFGLSRTQVGLSAPRMLRGLPRRPPKTMIWVLQKDTGAPRRLRAVFVTDEQVDRIGTGIPDVGTPDRYSWHGYTLLGKRDRAVRGAKPEEIYALVRLRGDQARACSESRVRVEAVFARQSDADRELAARQRRDNDEHWAVISYPTGQMLF